MARWNRRSGLGDAVPPAGLAKAGAPRRGRRDRRSRARPPGERGADQFGIAEGYASAEAMLDRRAPRHCRYLRAARGACAAGPAGGGARASPSSARSRWHRPCGGRGAGRRTPIRQRPVMVHDNWRFRATYRRIRHWLDAGVVGDIRRVQLDYLSSGMIPDDDRQAPGAGPPAQFSARSSGCWCMEVMIHHLDTLRFLLGELDLVDARRCGAATTTSSARMSRR